MVDSPEEWFHRRATHYVETQMLFHLGQAGVFHRLDSGEPCSVEAMATDLGLVPEVLATCLEYVHGIDGLLSLDDEGRYGLTEFGGAVLARFGRVDEAGKHFNLFDVRVGAYGPVWSGLGQLLSGETRYGEGVQREGALAAGAVYTISTHMIEPLHRTLQQIGARAVLEVGVSTGLLALLGALDPSLMLRGLDRNEATLEAAELHARELRVLGIEWSCEDFFRPEDWAHALVGTESPVIFSVHFHELLAAGRARMVEALRTLGRMVPGVRLLAMEQPRLPVESRGVVEESTWLYSQSNVLIHHLIGNGRILTQAQWNALFTDAGGVIERCDPLGFLGYNMMEIRLDGGRER